MFIVFKETRKFAGKNICKFPVYTWEAFINQGTFKYGDGDTTNEMVYERMAK
jgi:hypothetical protein